MPWGEHPLKDSKPKRDFFRQDYQDLQDCLRWCWKLHKTFDAHEIETNSFSMLSVSSAVKFAENSVKAV
jgi:hypothetical protein